MKNFILFRGIREVIKMLERPLCPECGGLLSMDTSWDKETEELIISLFCDGDRDDFLVLYNYLIISSSFWSSIV